jgi:hypothetical protein
MHIATVNAFKNKFGNYTGAIRDERTKEVTRERFDTFDEARNWVRTQAWDRFGPVHYAAMPRKGEYLANVWAAS